VSRNGIWEAIVSPGSGNLFIHRKDTPSGSANIDPIATNVTPSIAFSPDSTLLAYSPRDVYDVGVHIMLVSLPPTSLPRSIAGASEAEQVLAFSSDGRRLAYVAPSESGIMSVFVIGVDEHARPIQVTNVGVRKDATWIPGTPPKGVQPLPDSIETVFLDGNVLTWVNKGVKYTAEVPDGSL
jgi:Tol biopolymer transport system component